ncbi:MAG TPA: ABC transporter permease subunit [Tepidisphaeraceae bacterium]|nr:ABC transporter permease subunit [Tepidisphaeraceae bacterium]
MVNQLFPLIRKDWRLFRVPVLAVLILALMGYNVCFLLYRTDQRQFGQEAVLGQWWNQYMNDAAWFGLFTAVIMSAVFGGAAFATERRERWGDFLNLLPPGRALVIASKLLVSFATLAAIAAAHLLVLRMVGTLHHAGDWIGYMILGSGAAMLFGVSWMLSTVLRSASLSASIAIALTIGAALVVAMVGTAFDWKNDWGYTVFTVLSAVTGVVCFGAGTIYYLRRVEP